MMESSRRLKISAKKGKDVLQASDFRRKVIIATLCIAISL
jgi:hypothetical protein